MKLNAYLTIFIAITLSLPVVSLAGHHYSGQNCTMSGWEMTDLDADQDGEISFEEYADPHMEKLRTGFDMIDSDKDGFISESEWDELLNAHGMKKDQ